MSEKGIYLLPPIQSNDELDKLKKAIYLFSCYRKVSGRVPTPLRGKLVSLLAIYVKYGITKETKKKAEEILNLGAKGAINSLNMELRKNGYLVQDNMNNHINHLHPDLEKLQEYVRKNEDLLTFALMIKQ